MTKKKSKKKQELKITYTYMGHANEAEAEVNRMRVNNAYDMLFTEVEKKMKEEKEVSDTK